MMTTPLDWIGVVAVDVAVGAGVLDVPVGAGVTVGTGGQMTEFGYGITKFCPGKIQWGL